MWKTTKNFILLKEISQNEDISMRPHLLAISLTIGILLSGCGNDRLDQAERNIALLNLRINKVSSEYYENDKAIQADIMRNNAAIQAENASTRIEINKKLREIEQILNNHNEKIKKICLTHGNGNIATIHVCPEYVY
ncbi:MAG: hypothetical protein ACT6Q8_00790 [Niveispirillum sp.]|uniref:hypothetical protein n=1 Tax=Niveispirillum sp. TaxID=1917217 RepID=UPI004036AD9E